MHYFKLFFLFLFISSTSYSQNLRKEIEVKYLADQYNVVPVGNQGIVMFAETDVKDNSKKRWAFIKYNTNFEEEWTKEFDVPKKMFYSTFYSSENNLYLLMRYGYEFQILDLNVATGDIKYSYGKCKSAIASVHDFKVMNNVAYIGGDKKPPQGEACLKSCIAWTFILPIIFPSLQINYDAFLVINKLDSKNTLEVPLFEKGNSVASSIKLNEKKNTVDVIVDTYIQRQSVLFLKEVDENGQVLHSTLIKPEYKSELLAAQVSSISNDEKIIVGAWGRKGGGSQGMFFSKVENNKQQYIKQYSFTDFKNFFNYLSQSSEKNLKKKAANKKSKGKDLKLNYNLLIHDIIQRGDEYIMIAEAYYAEYRTEPTYVFDANGGHYVYKSVFVGYRYTHAIVAGFNKEGVLLWDNCFEIWNVLSKRLKERVKLIPSESELVLAYSYKGEINYKIVSENSVVEDKKRQPIKTEFSSDKIQQDFDPELEYWYDNYFIAYGVQRIKNKEDKTKRKVFYLNKVEF